MICIDNSEWMRNGDYAPSRFQAQADAVNLICGAKTQVILRLLLFDYIFSVLVLEKKKRNMEKLVLLSVPGLSPSVSLIFKPFCLPGVGLSTVTGALGIVTLLSLLRSVPFGDIVFIAENLSCTWGYLGEKNFYKKKVHVIFFFKIKFSVISFFQLCGSLTFLFFSLVF